MGLKLRNNAFSTVPNGVLLADTQITLATGTGVRFPILGTGDYFYATIADVYNNFEIVKVTARTDDILTVLRAQENTSARVFPPNSRFEIRVTVGNMLATFSDLNFMLL
jgi:hypothetical protein